jgi:hypothetical protein
MFSSAKLSFRLCQDIVQLVFTVCFRSPENAEISVSTRMCIQRTREVGDRFRCRLSQAGFPESRV